MNCICRLRLFFTFAASVHFISRISLFLLSEQMNRYLHYSCILRECIFTCKE